MAKDSRADRRIAKQDFKNVISGVSPNQLGDMHDDGVDHLGGGRVRRRRRGIDRGAAQMSGTEGVKLTLEQQQAQSAARAAERVAAAKADPKTAARIADMMRISMGGQPAAGPRQEP